MTLITTVFVVCVISCARDKPSEVAISRWEACVDSILILDQVLDSVEIDSLPQGRGHALNRHKEHYLRLITSLPISKKLEEKGCQIEGVRDYGAFRLYELHHFVRHLTEYSSTLEEITERHLMVIGDLNYFDFKKVPQLSREKLLVVKEISPQIKYLITQNY